MIEVQRTTSASPAAVWEVLAEGWSFASWVVGTARVRAVSPDWPAVGAVLHHSVGTWPLLLDDTTSVLRCEPERDLVLQARGWPLGEATIEVMLLPADAGGCRIRMREDATAGPGRYVPYPVRLATIGPRNEETLQRLCYLAERRPE